ncbi:MAG: TolC family protein [Alphaproteobacteria bacterium]|jgi:outer membrane protein TolC|nr:TolC family protein [Alphaproteobacteria bacterium]MBT4082220.1 TolC family protein [Alphaproteobacteria bacterium]MBT4544989.1 TolC family protein [Alphaproteobacteria bacterium]MBT7745772.1 TolC family protein [Alphaproteobacteria bacterium]
MANGTVRGLLVLFSASALIGASWSPLRAPQMPGYTSSGYSKTDRFGSPVVYVSLAALDRGFVPLPQAFTNVALGSDEAAPAEPPTKPLPFLRKLRFGKHKDYERLVFDFSDRLDFWYWTMPQQDTLTLEFPLLQPYENKPNLSSKSKLITGTRFAGNSGKKGGKFAIGLAENSRLKRIFLLPPGKSGGHRLVVDISKIKPKQPPSLGTGMAWGGGDAIDNIGTTLLARLYGSGSAALATEEKQKQPKAGSTSKILKPVRPMVRTNAVLTKSTFDPLWPQPVDAKTKVLQAQALSQSLKDLIASHDRIKAARLDVTAARETMAGLKKGNTPTLDITAFYGYERQNKPSGSADTNMPPREIDFTLTQLVSDFGAMYADEEKAELAVARADAILQATVQAVVLEGLAAHYQLAGARQSLRYARLSEQNIKRQTALEDARVQRGSGLATDVLQAKAQLAGAGARRVQAEGAQAAARYRYLAVFGALPEDAKVFLTLPVPDEKMPETLEGGIDVALAKNPLLEVGRLASEIARAETRRLKSTGYYPELNLIAEAKWKKDVGGTVGSQQEQIIRLEMTFPFNLAGAAVDTVNASKQAYLASSQRLAETRTLVRETVQSAWQQFRTAKLSARQLRNQADLAAEFLGLARKERKLGKRSLTEVLSGEAALANARSDAVAAENDLAVSAWTLLATMGTLDPESVI